MIKNIRVRITTDMRGKIKTGMKTSSGNPKSLDYFNIELFPELIQMYGNEPQKLLIYVPSDKIDDFLDCNYEAWASREGKSVKKRQCDSEECLHRIDEKIDGKEYKAGEITECICESLPEMVANPKKHGEMMTNPARCRYTFYLKAFIAHPQTGKIENPSCYFFENHSKNSGDAIISELEKIRALNMGVLRGVPFVLSVKMVSGKSEAKKKFPIWGLQALGTLSELREKSGSLLSQFDVNLDGLPAAEVKQIEEKPAPTNEPNDQDALFLEQKIALEGISDKNNLVQWHQKAQSLKNDLGQAYYKKLIDQMYAIAEKYKWQKK